MKSKLVNGVALLALLLSGCSGIPTSSQVFYGEEISEDTSTQFVRVIARPPSNDMSPEEIVRGFLDACTVEVIGQGAGKLPTDESHLIAKTIIDACKAFGTEVTGLQCQMQKCDPAGSGIGVQRSCDRGWPSSSKRINLCPCQ